MSFSEQAKEARPETPSEKPSEYYHIPQTPCAKALSTLIGHKDSVTTFAVDFTRGRVLSGSGDETLKLWEIPRGTEQRGPFVEQTVDENGVEGSTVKRSSSKSSSICHCIATLRGHTLPVTVVRADFRRHIAVSGSDDMAIRVWDLQERKCTCTLDGHAGYVLAMASDFPRFRVVTTSSDYTMRLWDVERMHADGEPMVGHVKKVLCVFTNKLGDHLEDEEKEKEQEQRRLDQEQRRLAAAALAAEKDKEKEQEQRQREGEAEGEGSIPQPQES